MVKEISQESNKTLYVDDLVIHYATSSINHIQRKLQLPIKILERWRSNNVFKLSNGKNIAVHLHCNRTLQQEPSLMLNNKNIAIESKVKLLDYDWTKDRFEPHIKYINSKAIKRLNILIILSHYNWESDRENFFEIVQVSNLV